MHGYPNFFRMTGSRQRLCDMLLSGALPVSPNSSNVTKSCVSSKPGGSLNLSADSVQQLVTLYSACRAGAGVHYIKA